MTAHADTIRRHMRWGGLDNTNPVTRQEAWDALDALLAENQQLEADLDRTTTAGNRIEQQLVEAASVMTKLRAENQRLRMTLEWLHRLSQTDSNPYVHQKIGEALAGDAE